MHFSKNRGEGLIFDKKSLFSGASMRDGGLVYQDNSTTKYCGIAVRFPWVRLEDFLMDRGALCGIFTGITGGVGIFRHNLGIPCHVVLFFLSGL